MVTISKEELTELVKKAYLEGCEDTSNSISYSQNRDGYYCSMPDIDFEEEFKGTDSEYSINEFFSSKLYKNFENF